MIKTLTYKLDSLSAMKKYPKEIFFIGDDKLLNKRKISLIGSRRPNSYTKQYTHNIAKALSNQGVCIVSGAAMGVDAIAHLAAGASNTIAVAGTGLDIRYPAVNKKLIEDIEKNGLVLSQFKEGTPSTRYNFPIRNELVVALGEVLVVTQADIDSGSMRSIEYALKMEKPIYVLPHRIGESDGTNDLLKKGLATAIYDIDEFVSNFLGYKNDIKHVDDFLEYCKTNPTFDEAMRYYPSEVFENELTGNIVIKSGRVHVV